jgi:Family of unknown function (DUF5684)
MDYYSPNQAAEMSPAAVTAFIMFILFFIVIAYVVTSLLVGKLFKKAGIESWIAWVPFYNSWKMLEMGGQAGYWAVLSIFPIVSHRAKTW